MKKILLSATLVMACVSASAQKLNFIPWTENGYLTGTTISDNGKFIAGSDRGGQAFIYNTETGKIKYYLSKELESGETVTYNTNSKIWDVNNEGEAVGYVGENAARFSFESGLYDLYKSEDASGAFHFMSSEGNMFGQRWDKSYYRNPFMVDNDGNEKILPLPSPSWFGWEDFQGGSIDGGSADGSVLVGYIKDNFNSNVLTFWIKNYNAGGYSVVPVGKQYYDGSVDLCGDQPFDFMGDNCISSNGKWSAFIYHKKDDNSNGYQVARYNVMTDHVEYISCPLSSGSINYYVTGISDEGTIIGYVQDASNARKGFIVYGDGAEAKLLADVYPDVKEWAELDNTGNNTPCHISSDGRYISGFGYVNYNETTFCYGTYWFDAEGETNSISSVKTSGFGNVEESYSLDGRKVVGNAPNVNQIVINRYDNGEVKKILK